MPENFHQNPPAAVKLTELVFFKVRIKVLKLKINNEWLLSADFMKISPIAHKIFCHNRQTNRDKNIFVVLSKYFKDGNKLYWNFDKKSDSFSK